MREMLYITFSDKLHAAPQEEDGKGISLGLNVGALMKLVARNAKNGAQLTPQGTLRWPLSSAQADVVLAETRELLEMLRPQNAAAS
jgi:transcription-repair coupling factor (superfamily II helicase)